jgi:hypothetical protein
MGDEARCTVRFGDATSKGKALLETDELRFRGDFRLVVSLRELESVEAADGKLAIRFKGGEAVFELGAKAARWAERIRNPRTRLDKLGVKPDSVVSVVALDDADFKAELGTRAEGSATDPQSESDLVFLGAEWDDPLTGQRRFFHPSEAESYEADGYPVPRVNPRWWQFSGGQDQLARPQNDQQRYERMATAFPNPVFYQSQQAYETARDQFFNRLRTDGQNQQGNWIGVLSAGPIPRVEAGASITVVFGFVAALKPEQFQTLAGRPIDNEETRRLIRGAWAAACYSRLWGYRRDNGVRGDGAPIAADPSR